MKLFTRIITIYIHIDNNLKLQYIFIFIQDNKMTNLIKPTIITYIGL